MVDDVALTADELATETLLTADELATEAPLPAEELRSDALLTAEELGSDAPLTAEEPVWETPEVAAEAGPDDDNPADVPPPSGSGLVPAGAVHDAIKTRPRPARLRCIKPPSVPMHTQRANLSTQKRG